MQYFGGCAGVGGDGLGCGFESSRDAGKVEIGADRTKGTMENPELEAYGKKDGVEREL